MAIPDRIARTVEIARPPAAVGAALTRASELGDLIAYLDAA